MRPLLVFIVVALVIYGVGLAVAEMPAYGRPNPTFNYVMDRYNTKAVEDTGAINVIASIILDYRAYDTLIETVVLFSAIIAAILVLKTPQAGGDGRHG